ncbi:hypothetical protein MATL_G00112740 [Megalops atlanticus]|uniref:Coiled-coil domain-containing protein 27 n=1 Tax=Megalops atlanticus TaxID=7932 RepID=A0A9D3TE66_MEGAT|nr:hypothetical protein MATL_G00112740 [Megalops atlanticus]
MAAAGEKKPLERPKTGHSSSVKTYSEQPLLRKTWTPPHSHSKVYSVSSVTKNLQGCQSELDHLPSIEDNNACPTCTNTSSEHLKTSKPAPFTRACRCLPSQKGITSVAHLNQESLSETQENKPTSTNPALANGTGGRMPWYLTVIHEKEQCLLKLGEEITRLSEFETQCSRKDQEILVLQEKMAEVTSQVHLAHNDEVIKAQAELILQLGVEIQQLRKVEEEALEKSHLITELKEEIRRMKESGLQWETGTVVSTQQDGESVHCETEIEPPQNMCPETQSEHLVLRGTENTVFSVEAENFVSLTEQMRDVEMANKALKEELEETKRNYMISTGTVCSLRRALSAREGELAKARGLVEELKIELGDRLAQIQAMSRKFSCLREGKANEDVLATLETENYTLRQLTAQLKEEVSQKDQAVAKVMSEVQQLQKHLLTETAAQTELRREGQANQETMNSLYLQHSKTKVSLEQMQSRFERLRMKIIQAVYSAPGAKQPQAEISDSALLQAVQKIIDDRTTFHQRLLQKGEKIPPLTIADMQNIKTAFTSPKKT